MSHYFEYNMYLSVDTTDKMEILSSFERCKSFQMPVVDDGYLVGIVDLFDIIKVLEPVVDLSKLLRTNFYVAGEKEGIFSFKLFNQDILPFVGADGKYKGFCNRITLKCYIPSEEYLNYIDLEYPKEITSKENIKNVSAEELEELDNAFDMVVEDNYEGLYITVDKGKTLNLNNHSYTLNGVTDLDAIDFGDDDISHFSSINNPKVHEASIVQIMQERNEISLMRVTSDMFDVPKMRKEISEMHELAENYKQRLDELEAERNLTQVFVCKSPNMRKIMELIIQISRVDSAVLLEGESGVGKGLVSETIHKHSRRKNKPFVKIDCASIPPTLMESELFGYEKGAFTGAEKSGKKGLIELANGGTLFLDEIGEVPLELQSKLLSMLQDKVFYRVGGVESISVDVRVISATNRDLLKMIEEGNFRRDLYYRLKVIPITIPPLRERKEDARYLIDYFLKHYSGQYGLTKRLTRSAHNMLLKYEWPGNVRELQHIMEYLVVTTSKNIITDEDVVEAIGEPEQVKKSVVSDYLGMSLKEADEAFEKELIQVVMKNSRSTLEIAEELGVDRSTITRKLQKYNLSPIFLKNEEQ